MLSTTNRSEGRPIIGRMAVFVAWLAVALYFGWREALRKAQLDEAIVDLSHSLGADIPAVAARDLQVVIDRAGQPDGTALALLALLIAARSFFTIVGETRLQAFNARIAGVFSRA